MPRLPLVLASALFVFGAGVFGYSVWKRSPEHAATPPPTGAPRTPSSVPVRRYTVRGRIEQLPSPTVKGSMLHIHHERITDWVNGQGTPVGMNEMVMPFPPAPGVSLDGLAVGDLVEFTVEFDYSRSVPQQTVAITKLPAGTKVDIEGVH